MGAENLKSNHNPLTDKRLIEAFLEGVKKTFETMASTPILAEKASVTVKSETSAAVIGNIGMVSGDMRGFINICFDESTACKVYENMLGESHQSVNNEVADAVGELTNQVYGTAKATLNQMGYAFEMALPSVILGVFRSSSPGGVATLVLPFKLKDSNHRFTVEVSVLS